MRDVIHVKLDKVYPNNQQLNEIISQKSYFFDTVKSKAISSLFEQCDYQFRFHREIFMIY